MEDKKEVGLRNQVPALMFSGRVTWGWSLSFSDPHQMGIIIRMK